MSEFEPQDENPENEGEAISGSWDSYLINTEDGIASNFVDLGVRPDEPNLHTMRCLIRVHLTDPDEYGMSTNEESGVLWKIEDALEEMMQQERSGRYVGRSTHSGMRVFCYYMEPSQCPEPEDVAAKLAEFDAYVPELNLESDPEWEFYFEFLYPSPEEWQCLQNRNLIEVLIEHGDQMDVPREIDHWIYFKSSENRAAYLQAVEEMGFTVRAENETDDGLLGLQIFRVEPIVPYDIDELTLTLYKLAVDHDGDYSGWETPVIKGEEEGE